jgi:hypothetical protein
MALSFAELKKQRAASREKLTKELTKQKGGGYEKDERYWYPEQDKAGNGFAIVRFLPAPEGEDVPFVRLWEHRFEGPGGWYIENSLTTIGQQDPIAEYNSELWNSTKDDDSPARNQVRKQKRKMVYISNVLVIKDPAHPENEGKVKLYKYGKKVFDKLNEAMNPQYEDESPFNPFDLWEGANFKIKVRKVDGWPNYDKSEFDDIEPLDEDEEVMEAIWGKCYSLQAELAPDKFKSYEQLKVALDRVLRRNANKTKAVEEAEDAPFDTDEEEEVKPARKAVAAKALPGKKAKPAPKKAVEEDDEEEDDDTMNFLQNLAEDED